MNVLQGRVVSLLALMYLCGIQKSLGVVELVLDPIIGTSTPMEASEVARLPKKAMDVLRVTTGVLKVTKGVSKVTIGVLEVTISISRVVMGVSK